MNKLIKVSETVTRLTFNTAAVLLALAAMLVFYQVITRFVFGHSAVWSEVWARAVIVWGVFLVLGPAIRHSRMIPIDVIRSLFSQNKRIWIIRTVSVAVALFLLVLIWFGYKMTLRVVDQQAAMLNLSVAWFYVAIPVGALLAIPGLFLAQLDAENEHRQLSEVSK